MVDVCTGVGTVSMAAHDMSQAAATSNLSAAPADPNQPCSSTAYQQRGYQVCSCVLICVLPLIRAHACMCFRELPHASTRMLLLCYAPT